MKNQFLFVEFILPEEKKFFNNTDVIYLQEISLFKKLVRKKKEQRFFCHEFSNKTEGGIV